MPRPPSRILYIVFGGGNDLLAAVGEPQVLARVDTAVASLRSIVGDLISQHATDILVPNIPDIGMTQEVRARGNRAVAEAGRLTDYFNAAVNRALAELAATRDVRIYRLDVWHG